MPRFSTCAAFFLGGATLLLHLPRLPHPALTLLAIPVISALACRYRLVVPLAALTAGFAWVQLHAEGHLAQRLQGGAIDRQVVAVITGLVRRQGDRLDIPVVARLDRGRAVKLSLRWYEYPAERQPPRPGQRWLFTVRLKVPRGSANPGLGYWEDRAFRERIAASGYVREARRLTVPGEGRSARLAAFRDTLSQRIKTILEKRESAPLVLALAVGDRRYLGPVHWQTLRDTGLAHLVAISGLHIGIVAGLVYLAAAMAFSQSQRGTLAACLVSVAAALFYAALAGFALPTVRALVGVVTCLALRVTRRRVDPFAVLSVALVVVLLLDPLAPLDQGFWLSFGAVLVILLFARARPRAALWRLQLALLAGLVPLTAAFFGQVALAAPLVNLLLLPLFSVLLIPAVLAGSLALLLHVQAGAVLLVAAAAVLDRVWPLLTRLAGQPWLVWTTGPVTALELALAVAGALVLVGARTGAVRLLGLVCLLPLLASGGGTIRSGGFTATVLDVGQGLAVVVRSRRHTLLYDTGPRWRNGDAATRIVVPYLRGYRLPQPDRIVVSHGDADHAGGLEALQSAFPGVRVSGAGGHPCRAGDRWWWDGLAFEILHPPAGHAGSDNDASCVLRITGSGGCLLLTGDIEAEVELALVSEQRDRLRCELLVVPHHGSTTSSSTPFVRAVAARVAVVSVAHGNRWGLPRPEVVHRWRRTGAMVVDTASAGAVGLVMDPDGGIGVVMERCRVRRFWRPPCIDPAGDAVIGLSRQFKYYGRVFVSGRVSGARSVPTARG